MLACQAASCKTIAGPDHLINFATTSAKLNVTPRLDTTLDRMEQKGDTYHTDLRQGFLELLSICEVIVIPFHLFCQQSKNLLKYDHLIVVKVFSSNNSFVNKEVKSSILNLIYSVKGSYSFVLIGFFTNICQFE